MSVRSEVETIYAAERDAVYAYLLYLGVPAERAQELAQDAFLKLYLKMTQGEAIDNPGAWLHRVAHNLALRFHGREPVYAELAAHLEVAHSAPNPEHALLAKQRQAALARAMDELSPQQKHCMYLRGQGLRYREIAATLDISTSAVGEFLRRAVSRLKEALHG